MKVSLKKAFSLLDGRLSTNMTDVQEMLSYIFDRSLATHQLSSALHHLRYDNPKWFSDAVDIVDEIKIMEESNDFDHLMKVIDLGYSNFEIELQKL
jgi:hypothetical protein